MLKYYNCVLKCFIRKFGEFASDFLSSFPYPPINVQSLRSDLLSSALTAELLVTLTPEDLATDELRQARQTINKADRESRRTDWLEEHKGKIQVK